MERMERIRLVQRLRKQIKSGPLAGMVNSFAFGGGKVNGGLSKEEMDMLKKIFIFDYMGSAEFEWGALPRAFVRIYENKKANVAFEMQVETKEKIGGVVYVICDRRIRDDVQKWIRSKAFDEWDKKYRTKEYVGLESVIDNGGISSDINRLCGWMELDNGFFFFTDREMFEETARLFEVDIKNSRIDGALKGEMREPCADTSN